jgi:hypothetical protein
MEKTLCLSCTHNITSGKRVTTLNDSVVISSKNETCETKNLNLFNIVVTQCNSYNQKPELEPEDNIS